MRKTFINAVFSLIYGNGIGIGAAKATTAVLMMMMRTTTVVEAKEHAAWIMRNAHARAIVVETEILFRININKISNANGVVISVIP